ncbi:MAG: lysophospholipase [Gemmataceae bacterium]|nr:lysophospholipase [Gemmataceae bacterium]
MRRLLSQRSARTILAAVAFTFLPVAGLAQTPDPQKIQFESVDKVILRGTFYPSAKAGPQSPAVLLVHKLGSDRQQPGYESLAKALQAKGFAVLTFDFRGHGDSTVIKEEFWKYPSNTARNIRGGNPKAQAIEFKDFQPSYYPMLVNDIAAAKFALELKHNAKECNVGDLIIIGAEDGAALVSFWVGTEAMRRRSVPNPMGGFPIQGEPEVKDIAAVVHLSIRSTLGSGTSTKQLAGIPGWLSKDAKIRDKVGQFFLVGKLDTTGDTYANYLYKDVLKGPMAKNKLIFKAEVPETKLTGTELLKKSLPTEEWIIKYAADKVMDARAGTVLAERDLKQYPLMAVPLAQFGVTVP